jgi:hypothetical protein
MAGAARVRTAMIVVTDAVDTIATIILIAMMLVPLANIVTGAIVGTGLAGPAGGLVGIVAGLAITLISSRVGYNQTRHMIRPRGASRGSFTRHHVSPDPSAQRAPGPEDGQSATRRLEGVMRHRSHP